MNCSSAKTTICLSGGPCVFKRLFSSKIKQSLKHITKSTVATRAEADIEYCSNVLKVSFRFFLAQNRHLQFADPKQRQSCFFNIIGEDLLHYSHHPSQYPFWEHRYLNPRCYRQSSSFLSLCILERMGSKYHHLQNHLFCGFLSQVYLVCFPVFFP